MSAISGTRRAIKELADGTVRVQIDVDPQHRKRFFELFADIDMPVALAPLAHDFDQPKASTDAAITEAAKEAVKGGALSKAAAMLCANAEFRDWLRVHTGENMRDPLGWDEEMAARKVRAICRVDSRAELDHDPDAAQIFHEQIRKPWVRVQGRSWEGFPK